MKSEPMPKTGLRKWLHCLRLTPLHPQFFAYRYERLRYRLTSSFCSGRVLDIGSGRQPMRRYLENRCEYVALDHPSSGALYNTRPIVYGDAVLLPFMDGAFDTVICLEVIEHLKTPERALHESRRVLKPGGLIIISAPFIYPIHDAPADYRRWTRHGFELLADSTGLHIESLREFGTPLETGLLTAGLGLAWLGLRGPRAVRLPFILLAMITIPVFNILGFVLSSLIPSSSPTPFAIGYMAVLRVPAKNVT